MQNKILLLGSGELGKEVTIAMQRLGQYIIAVDNYHNAPAMQVAHNFEVIKPQEPVRTIIIPPVTTVTPSHIWTASIATTSVIAAPTA